MLSSPLSGGTSPRRRLRTKTRVSGSGNRGGIWVQPPVLAALSPRGDGIQIDPSLWASPSPAPKTSGPHVSENMPTCAWHAEGDVNDAANRSQEWSDKDLAAALQQQHSRDARQQSLGEHKVELASATPPHAQATAADAKAVNVTADVKVELASASPPLAEVEVAGASPPHAEAIAADAEAVENAAGVVTDIGRQKDGGSEQAAESPAHAPLVQADAAGFPQESVEQPHATHLVEESAPQAVVAQEPAELALVASATKQQRLRSRQPRVRSRAGGRRRIEALPLMDVDPRSPRRPASHSEDIWPSFDALAAPSATLPWSLWPAPLTFTKTGEIVKTFEGPRAKRARLAGLLAEQK